MSYNQTSELQREISGLFVLVTVMWGVFLLDRFTGIESFGLVPRTLHGLTGIIAMPVLHKDLSHIVGNTIPLLVLGILLAGSSSKTSAVIASIWILSGIGLWIFGRTALHIGASGVVFGLVAFLIVAGMVEKRFAALAVSLIVGIVYGGTLFTGILPLSQGTSWDGHLMGAIAGICTAFILRTGRHQNPWG